MGWKHVALGALLVGLTLVAWAPALDLPFLNFDDPEYVVENPHVTAGLTAASVRWAFTHVHHASWHPLTGVSHMLDVELYGLDPRGHHLTSVLLHALAALTLFLAFTRLTGAALASAALAAVFAIHPLRVESVAWVSERKDVLCGVGWMLALWAYAAWVARPAWWRYALVVGACAVALLAKPMAVTLPAALLLLDWWPLGRWRRGLVVRLVLEKAPLFVLAATMSVVTVMAQRASGAVASLEALPLGARIGNALVAYVTYVVQTVWPRGLAVFYPLRPVPLWEAVAAALLLAAVTLLVWWARRRRPYLLAGWLWYLVTLLPVIGLIKAGEQALADRFTYIPGIGLGIMAVWWLAEIAARSRAARLAVAVTAAAALAAAVVTTRRQLAHWESNLTLFSHALAVTRDNQLAHTNLGEALTAAGRHEEALAHYREAVRLEPDSARLQTNLGIGLAARGERAAAHARYEHALRLDPGHAPAHFNLGVLLAAEGRVDDAMTQYRDAIRLRPDYAKAHSNLGLLLLQRGQPAEAVEHFATALRAAPRLMEARGNLALALEALGRPEEAVAQYREALRWSPRDPRLHHNLGGLLVDLGRPAEALGPLREAVRLTQRRDPALLEQLAAAEASAAHGGTAAP